MMSEIPVTRRRPSNTITDLAVLGLLQDGPVAATDISSAAKSLVPEFWHPTCGVIEAAIQINVDRQYVRQTTETTGQWKLSLAPTGAARTRELIRTDPADFQSHNIMATEALQFCFLAFADEETIRIVLDRFRLSLDQRRASLQERCRRCPHRNRYMDLWVNMELKHLDGMMADVSALKATSSLPTSPNKVMSTRRMTGSVR